LSFNESEHLLVNAAIESQKEENLRSSNL